jgi:hypothetical protein
MKNIQSTNFVKGQRYLSITRIQKHNPDLYKLILSHSENMATAVGDPTFFWIRDRIADVTMPTAQ